MGLGIHRVLVDEVSITDTDRHYSKVYSADQDTPLDKAHFVLINSHNQTCVAQFEGAEDENFTDPYNVGDSIPISAMVEGVKGVARTSLTDQISHLRVMYQFEVEPAEGGALTITMRARLLS